MSDESFETAYEAAGQSHIEGAPDDSEEKIEDNNEGEQEDGEAEYDVERILSRRSSSKRGGQKTVEYLVRWKGYESEYDTWEPQESLDCPEILKAFNEEHSESSDGDEVEKEDEGVESTEEVPEGKYVVEGILNRRVLPKLGRRRSTVVEYQVKWKDYDETTWEPEGNLNCGQLLEQFAADHPDRMIDSAVMIITPPRRGRTSTATSATKKNRASSAKKTERDYTPRRVSKAKSSQSGRSRQRVLQKRNSDDQGEEDDNKEASDDEENGQEEGRSDQKAQQGDTDDDEDEPAEYEVEKVVGRRSRGPNSMVEYHLKWKGYSKLTWEREENLTHCIDLLREYEKKREQMKGGNYDDDDDDGDQEEEDEDANSPPRKSRKTPARKQLGRKPSAKKQGKTPVRKQVNTGGKQAAKAAPRKAIGRPRKEDAEEASGTLAEFLTDFRGQPLQKGDDRNNPGPSTKRGIRTAPQSSSRDGGQNSAKKRKMYEDMGSFEVPNAEYSKVLPIFLMKGSKVLARKDWKFRPTDLDDWSFLDDKNFDGEEEQVRVLGKGEFADFDEPFYVIVQATAPNLFLGVTPKFLAREFPKTFAHHRQQGTFAQVQADNEDEREHTPGSSDISMQ